MFVRFLLIMGAVVIGIAGVLFSDFSPVVKTASQQKARTLKDRPWENEPIKVVAVKGNDGLAISLGNEQLADDDWLRDLIITIKNMSDKNIKFAELELHFTRPPGSSDAPVTAFPNYFWDPTCFDRARIPHVDAAGKLAGFTI